MKLRASLRDWLRRRMHVPTMEASVERLATLGFRPATVVDVGAYEGHFTRLAMRCWPQAEFHCFEPLDAPRAQLSTWARTQQGVQIYDSLLGASTRDRVPFHQAETASSVLLERDNQSLPVSHKKMVTLDATLTGVRGPGLLKLDVQGYELEVLKGGEHTLGSIEAIVAEVNLLDIHAGVPLAAEVFSWLSTRGFVAYDIAGLMRRPLDSALWQMDVVFVRDSSFLRNDKRWASR